MPIYSYSCPHCGRERDAFAHVAERHTKAPTCHGAMVLEIMPTMVQGDLPPYMAVGGDKAGQMITSRREHKEFLKRNNFREVGNEPIKPIKNDFTPRKGEIAQELKHVIPKVLRRD